MVSKKIIKTEEKHNHMQKSGANRIGIRNYINDNWNWHNIIQVDNF